MAKGQLRHFAARACHDPDVTTFAAIDTQGEQLAIRRPTRSHHGLAVKRQLL